MSLWNRHRTLTASGETTPAHATEIRLQQRREGFRQAVEERDRLAASDQQLLAEIASIDAMMDVSQPHEQAELRRKQDAARGEREPLRRRLEEIEAALPERERLIEEDVVALRREQFKQKCTDRNAWVEAEAEERKIFEDLLIRLCDSVRKLANWELRIRPGQQELGQEGRQLSLSFGTLWEGAPVAAEARSRIAEAWNAGSTERERVITEADPAPAQVRIGAMAAATRLPTMEGTEGFTSEDGEHTWEAMPLPSDRQAVCSLHEGCNQPAVSHLRYSAPNHEWQAAACTSHGSKWVRQYITDPQHRMKRFSAV